MAAGFVRQSVGGAFATAYTLTFSAASAAGSLLVAGIQHQAGALTSVVDNTGTAWTKVIDTLDVNTAGSGGRVGIWIRENAPSGVSSLVITAGAQSAINANVTEWSGMAVSSSVRTSATDYNSGSTTKLLTPVTAVAGDVVVSIFGYSQGSTRLDTLDAGDFTSLTGANISTTWMSAAYDLVATSGSVGPTWTLSASGGNHGQATVVLKPLVANTAPAAGADQTGIEPYTTVTLTATDAESTPAWTQTAGTPTVTLGGSGATRTFVAPATRAGTTLTFRATDAGGLNDEMTVTVLPHNEWAVIGGVEVPLIIRVLG